jgi:hypothetical protein
MAGPPWQHAGFSHRIVEKIAASNKSGDWEKARPALVTGRRANSIDMEFKFMVRLFVLFVHLFLAELSGKLAQNFAKTVLSTADFLRW